MLGLYLHIPFCSAICNYCNFNRGLFDAAVKARYIEALAAEIARAGPSTRGTRSGQVGGGNLILAVQAARGGALEGR